ncbi:MAG: hypothetical protein COA68_07470 [Oceanobacter sp.]|jgi:hypothetical protein|nr:MAG: hypothetical protein COA68_07470 [Oceanobacter sp.]
MVPDMTHKILTIIFASIALTACQTDGGSSDSGTSSDIDSGAIAGSTAALTFQNGNFVVLDRSTVKSYFFPEDGPVELNDTIHVWNAETIFPEGQSSLYVGSDFGVTILDINDAGKFTFVGEATHIASCDPVIVDGTTMFLTLRTTNNCTTATGLNTLMIYDVSDPTAPLQLSSLAMNGPYGLAKSDNFLWVCTEEGLAKVSVSDPLAPALVTTYPETQCNDIIIRTPSETIITSDGGIFLVNLSTGTPIIQSDILAGE